MPLLPRSAAVLARGAARHRDAGGIGTAALRAVRGGRGIVTAAAATALLGAGVAAGSLAGPVPDPAAGDPGRAPDVRAAAAEGSTRSAAAGTAVPGSAPVDLRAVPVPQVVDRATVGPLWLSPEDRAAGVLALEVPPIGSGVLDVVPGSSPAPGVTGVRSVRVEVERDLPVDGAAFAATVMDTLNDPRGWGARGEVSFARTDGPADIRVVLATPGTTDALCAPLPTGGEVSCGRNGHAALNARRWVLATPEFADRTLYRQYLVNHEVGHLLGHPHERCPGPGRQAPLMQQQSLRVAPCTANGWPFPEG